MNTSNQRRRSYIEYRLCRNLKTGNSAFFTETEKLALLAMQHFQAPPGKNN